MDETCPNPPVDIGKILIFIEFEYIDTQFVNNNNFNRWGFLL